MSVEMWNYKKLVRGKYGEKIVRLSNMSVLRMLLYLNLITIMVGMII